MQQGRRVCEWRGPETLKLRLSPQPRPRRCRQPSANGQCPQWPHHPPPSPLDPARKNESVDAVTSTRQGADVICFIPLDAGEVCFCLGIRDLLWARGDGAVQEPPREELP